MTPTTARRIATPLSVLLLSTSAIALSTSLARADSCSAATGGADIITCEADANPDNTPFSSLGGDDTININSGTFASDIGAGTDNDTINLNGGTVGGILSDGADNNTINLNGGTANLDVLTADGNDTITLNGSVLLEDISAAGGVDTIFLTAGTLTEDLFAGAGNDLITLDGATVLGDIEGDSDNDSITLSSGSVDDVRGDAGTDTITLSGATVNANIFGGADGDIINLNSGTVGNNVDADGGDDTITLAGALVTGNLFGDGGADTINVNSGTVGGDVLGADGNDTINFNGGTISGGDIAGGEDNDTINLNGGSIVNVQGNDGTDTITLNGTTVTGAILGQGGSDVIILTTGTAGTVNGDGVDGAGEPDPGAADTITLNGASVTGDILGELGGDTINLLSGSGVNANGGAGADAITLNGATLSGDVLGGDDGDTINLLGGSAVNANGEAGADTITLDGAALSGDLAGGAGDDTFGLTSGTFGGSLLGGDGSDTATINAGFSLASITGSLDGGDDAAVADTFIDTLNIGAAGTLDGGSVINWETINVNGVALALTGAGLTTSADAGFGLFVNSGASVDLGDAFAITGNTTVGGGGTLLARTAGGTGSFSVSGNLGNSGLIDMSGASPAAGDTLTVGGDYDAGAGASLFLDAALDATLASDTLVITGNIIGAGSTTITLTDVGGPDGTPTGTGPGEGLALVDNSATGDLADGDFTLSGGAIVKGPLSYTLAAESDGVLYLQSAVQAQFFGFATLTEVMRDEFPTLRDRLGERRYNALGSGNPEIGNDNAGVWLRISGHERSIDGGDGTDPTENGGWGQSRGEVEVGLDIPMEVFDGIGVFGINIHGVQSYADNTVDGASEDTNIDATGFGAGVSFAWFAGGGFYADAQARLTAYDTEVTNASGSTDIETDAISYGVSLEVGNRVDIGSDMAVTPRGQVIYSDVSIDSFTDGSGAEVSQGDSASLIVEAGVTIETLFPDEGISLFADASVSHDTLGDSSIQSAGIEISSGLEDTWGTFQAGASIDLGDGSTAYLAADISSPFGNNFADSYGYGLKAGVKIDF